MGQLIMALFALIGIVTVVAATALVITILVTSVDDRVYRFQTA